MNDNSTGNVTGGAIDRNQSKRPHIPAPVVYMILLLGLAVVVLVLFEKSTGVHKTIEVRFQESLVEVKSNCGDVLEIATLKNVDRFSESDSLDASVLGITVPLGKAESILEVPVTYRFHVLLSDKWTITTTPETVMVLAPSIRPSLPPAPDISAMNVQTTHGWARFNYKGVEDRVKAQVTGALNIRAHKLASSQQIRDAARHSIESSLKNCMHWLPEECSKKVFRVSFADEITVENKPTRTEP